jgi:1-hydroxycarotenoid 3,4-desaturase
VTLRVAIVGGGIGGLACAARLAAAGCAVTLLEATEALGGKLREVTVAGRRIDSGPTVLTMRWVFDELFEACGGRLDTHARLASLSVLARHAWSDGSMLDLFADPAASEDAIGARFGAAEARGYARFRDQSRLVYETLEPHFILAPLPTPTGLMLRTGIGGIVRIAPFTSYWRALGGYFRDVRLRQLFARYATYCGADPFTAPATLMLVAHVESQGVWSVEGGMHRLADAIAALAEGQGARLRTGTTVACIEVANGRVAGVRLRDGERVAADAVVLNADQGALAAGLFGAETCDAVAGVGPARSLSAVTWSMVASASGFPLLRHNVFFSKDYEAEFRDLTRYRRLPSEPTLYICAQDRTDTPAGPSAEGLFCIMNAPADGDGAAAGPDAADAAQQTMQRRLRQAGLELQCSSSERTTPRDFHRLFPASGGALYGPANNGPYASFRRPGARTRVPGLYLAGGTVHPGPGLPMAALSGKMAAAAVLADGASTRT